MQWLFVTHVFYASLGDECDFGPTHHSHIVLPLATTAADCKAADARFVMSHGATFFCPHTFDVKLLATISEDSARAMLCDTHFDALASGASPKMVLRPTLQAGGLPALARGEMASWVSPVMYHVHSFGKNNDAGPDAGWNVSTVRSANTTVNVVRVLYGRQLDVQPKPAALTYLVHNGGAPDAAARSAPAVLTHYISTSGTSGFDQIAKATIRAAAGAASAPALRSTWPLFLTVPGHADDVAQRLNEGDVDVHALLHVYDVHGLPATQSVLVTLSLDYYVGTSDGFAGFGTMCPTTLPSPQSPSTCIAPPSAE